MAKQAAREAEARAAQLASEKKTLLQELAFGRAMATKGERAARPGCWLLGQGGVSLHVPRPLSLGLRGAVLEQHGAFFATATPAAVAAAPPSTSRAAAALTQQRTGCLLQWRTG